MGSQHPQVPSALLIPPVPPITDQSQWRRSSILKIPPVSPLAGLGPRMSARMSTNIQPLGADSQFKTTRPVTETSISPSEDMRKSSLSTNNTSSADSVGKRPSVRKARYYDVNKHTDFHWEVAARNPKNWSRLKRCSNTMMAAIIGLAVTFASSIVAPAHKTFMDQHKTSTTAAMLPFSLFILGLAFGPIISTILGDIYGRKIVYLLCFPHFAMLVLAAALVSSEVPIIITRFSAGFFAGPALSVGYTVMTELWHPEEHTVPLILYNAMLFLGAFLGMISGGFVVQHLSWSWTQWVSLFVCGACIPLLFFMSETSKKTIQRIRRHESRRAPFDPETLTTAFKRPLRMLFKEPIVMLQGLYVSFLFAVLYASFAAWPYVFSRSYVFDVGSQGLVFASMATGLTVAFFILLINHKLIYKPAVARFRALKLEETEKAIAARRQASFANERQKSIAWSIRRVTSINNRGSTAITALPQTIEQERNSKISQAASKYLNDIPANEGKRIASERILEILAKDPPYGALCEQLEAGGLKLDRVQLARAIVDALQPSSSSHNSSAASTPDITAPADAFQPPSPGSDRTSSSNGTPMARSKSLHFAAAASFGVQPPLPYPGFASRHSPPPPEWRLWPAPLASFLVVTALFMFGWTAQKHSPRISYFVAIVAMGIFACGAVIGVVTSTLYVFDSYGQQNGACALSVEVVGRSVLAAVLPLCVLQLYAALETAWATSVFGFVAAALGLSPCVLLVAGRRFRGWSRFATKN